MSYSQGNVVEFDISSVVDAKVTDLENDLIAHGSEAAPHSGHMDVDGSKALTGHLDMGGNSIKNQTVQSIADPDTITATGRYRTSGPITVGDYTLQFYIDHFNNDGGAAGYSFQFATAISAPNQHYMRTKMVGTWDAWREVATFSLAGVMTLKNGTTHGEVTGSPEGSTTAPVGSTRYRTDGGTSTTLYVKESGSGNTGWVAK